MKSQTKTKTQTKSKNSFYSFEGLSLTEFPSNINSDAAKIINVSNNPISSFEGIKEYPNLTYLICKNTKIETFQGAKIQPSLQTLTLSGSPLSRETFCRVMALIAFGNSLKTIDQVAIRESDRTLAQTFSSQLRPFIISGWVITSRNPIKIFNSATKQRKTFFPQSPPPSIPQSKVSRMFPFQNNRRYRPYLKISSSNYRLLDYYDQLLVNESTGREEEEVKETILLENHFELIPSIYLNPETALEFHRLCQDLMLYSNLNDLKNSTFEIIQSLRNFNQSYIFVFANTIILAANSRPYYINNVLRCVNDIFI